MPPPIFCYFFKKPIRYSLALTFQERIHAIQLKARQRLRHSEYLFLLEHRPVYTFGRRQADTPEARQEVHRLTPLGADCVGSRRGGQTTYHGPGQLIGYPMLDLGLRRPPIGIREYICRLQKTLETHILEEHGIEHIANGNTGVFLDEHTKIASIGVQVRHRLTTHGFSLNVTEEPLLWFDEIVACGLADVKAGCIARAAKTGGPISVEREYYPLAMRFGQAFGRNMAPLILSEDDEVSDVIRSLEEVSDEEEPWPQAPEK